MKASQQAFDLIKQSESLAKLGKDGLVYAYADPAKGWAVPTIGWGTTGANVTKNTVWTVAQCEEALHAHVANLEKELSSVLGASPTTQNQFDAFIDFSYNLGIANLSASHLMRYHKEKNYKLAQLEFSKWVFAGGKRLKGLEARRQKEANLYGKNS